MQIKRKGKTKIELRYCKLKMIKKLQEEMKSLQVKEEKMHKENPRLMNANKKKRKDKNRTEIL